MARWKPRVDFLLSVIGLLFLSVTFEALQRKRCQDSLLSGGGRSVRAKISGGRGCPWGIFFGFYKTRHILLSHSANCTVLRGVVLTQYRRVTDGRTDGIAIASTALAKRRAVKKDTLPCLWGWSETSNLTNIGIYGALLPRTLQRSREILVSSNEPEVCCSMPNFALFGASASCRETANLT